MAQLSAPRPVLLVGDTVLGHFGHPPNPLSGRSDRTEGRRATFRKAEPWSKPQC